MNSPAPQTALPAAGKTGRREWAGMFAIALSCLVYAMGLLQYFHWGSVFLVAVPAMMLLLLVSPMLLPEYRDSNAERIDLLSVAHSLVAVLLTIYGIKQAAEHGLNWGRAAIAVAGLAVGAAFVRCQGRRWYGGRILRKSMA